MIDQGKDGFVPVQVIVAGVPMLAYPKTFKSGGRGWHLSGKVTIQGRQVQVGLNLSIVGSIPGSPAAIKMLVANMKHEPPEPLSDEPKYPDPREEPSVPPTAKDEQGWLTEFGAKLDSEQNATSPKTAQDAPESIPWHQAGSEAPRPNKTRSRGQKGA